MRRRAAVGGAGVPALVGALAGCVVVWRSWEASSLSAHRWAAWTAIALSAWLAVAAARMRRCEVAAGSVPALIVIAQFAIYCCVPETGQIMSTSAAAVALVAVELITQRSTPWLVHVAFVALVMWSGVFGATGRESALIGTFFAWWPFVLVALFPRRSSIAAGVGAVAAVVVARTGALQPTLAPAVVAVAIAAPVSVVAMLAASGLGRAHPVDSRS